MVSVLKYDLGDGKVLLPIGAKILKVASQGGRIKLWAQVDREVKHVFRHFVVVGTGHTINNSESLRHVGTVFQDPFVWHVYERP